MFFPGKIWSKLSSSLGTLSTIQFRPRIIARRESGRSSRIIIVDLYTNCLTYSPRKKKFNSMDAFSSFFDSQSGSRNRWSYASLKNFHQISPAFNLISSGCICCWSLSTYTLEYWWYSHNTCIYLMYDMDIVHSSL